MSQPLLVKMRPSIARADNRIKRKVRFSYFKITAECKEVEEMYNPTLWPEGIFVRRFYEPRQPRPMAAGVNVPVLEGGARDAWS